MLPNPYFLEKEMEMKRNEVERQAQDQWKWEANARRIFGIVHRLFVPKSEKTTADGALGN
ncbi:hypothetical protein [Paenibacillus sp. MBLB4367]|uniref:hypothetical protein n=1 Tax=Paenibacillus sp. MBLB4367 TaxID=3384767 RepID=UPI003908082F